MRKLAITGGIACGKTCVGRMLEELGLEVLDTDHEGHRAIAKGELAYEELIRTFGTGILGVDEEIDRSVLGARVFADSSQRKVLNEIVHPRIREATQTWLAAQADRDASAVAVLVPLLFETSFLGAWDSVCCVASTRALQMQRLGVRGLSPGAAAQRIAAQLPLSEKMSQSDFVIFNAGTLSLLRRQTERTWMHILETIHE